MRIRAATVILSACETGLGQASGGDEVAGLTRSILLSGANTIVSSLWKVSAQSLFLAGKGTQIGAGLGNHGLCGKHVLRPGTFFVCRALTRNTSRPCSSSISNTGIQYTPWTA
jgi:CHAT domain